MASRRCIQELTRRATALLATNQTPYLSCLKPTHSLSTPISLKTFNSTPVHALNWTWRALWPCYHVRYFASGPSEESDESEEDYFSDGEEDTTPYDPHRVYSLEEKEAEAAEIGYKVAGPLERSDKVFKPYEPVFAVVQVGSHQFKVCNGDSIYTERLKFCEVNDKLNLNKVLLLGSKSQTIIGRPIVPDAIVHAVVEEHALDAKVLIFKKKRRKNYRRTKGHRQELTKLRIIDIQGIEKPERKPDDKPLKVSSAEPEKVEVAA